MDVSMKRAWTMFAWLTVVRIGAVLIGMIVLSLICQSCAIGAPEETREYGVDDAGMDEDSAPSVQEGLFDVPEGRVGSPDVAFLEGQMDAPAVDAGMLMDASVVPVPDVSSIDSGSAVDSGLMEGVRVFDAGRLTDAVVDTLDVPVRRVPRVQQLDSSTCDGGPLDLPDMPGMSWYHVCVTTPQFGIDSTHPYALERPTGLQFSQIWDSTLPEFSPLVAAPAGDEPWAASLAWATLDAPAASSIFNARYLYSGDRSLFGVGQNHLGGSVEFNGSMQLFQVMGGVQSLAVTEIVGAPSCDPSDGGSLHVPGTGCPPITCHTVPLACTP